MQAKKKTQIQIAQIIYFSANFTFYFHLPFLTVSKYFFFRTQPIPSDDIVSLFHFFFSLFSVHHLRFVVVVTIVIFPYFQLVYLRCWIKFSISFVFERIFSLFFFLHFFLFIFNFIFIFIRCIFLDCVFQVANWL